MELQTGPWLIQVDRKSDSINGVDVGLHAEQAPVRRSPVGIGGAESHAERMARYQPMGLTQLRAATARTLV